MKGRGRLTAMVPPAGLSALLLASVFWQSACKNDSDQEEDEGERKADRCAAAGQLDETFAQRGRHIQVHTVTQREREIIRMETHHCYYIFVFLQPTEAWDFITLFVQYQLAVRSVATPTALWGGPTAKTRTRDWRYRGTDTGHQTTTLLKCYAKQIMSFYELFRLLNKVKMRHNTLFCPR